MPHDTRDSIVQYITKWKNRSKVPSKKLFSWLGLSASKYHHWNHRQGQENLHNGKVPRDWWVTEDEKEKVIDFHHSNTLEGYRRLTYMMIDQNIAYLSPSTVYRTLKKQNLLDRKSRKTTKKGTEFHQPARPHQHWHTDISNLNLGGTFYFLISVLDGFSRAIIHWEICESMREQVCERVIQATLEKAGAETNPSIRPRIISDNGPQFIAKDFKEFLRVFGLSHVRTSPYYPQCNGKMERFHGSLKAECIRRTNPGTKEEATKRVSAYVEHNNNVHLHGSIGYMAPADKLEGREPTIQKERERNLKLARQRRKDTNKGSGTQQSTANLQYAIP